MAGTDFLNGGMGMGRPRSTHKFLAAIRIFNGLAGLLVPEFLLRRLGTDPRFVRSGISPFRMFGIRTVPTGLALLTLRDDDLRRASNRAMVTHACETVSTASASSRGDLPRKAGITATLFSATNTVPAVLAARRT